MARIAGRTIAALLAVLALPAAAQKAPAPPARDAPPPVALPAPGAPGGAGPAATGRPRGLAEALVGLHGFFRAEAQAANAVTMNPSTGPVTEYANTLADELRNLDLELTALAQRLGIEVERGGPLGATETARAWAQEQRMLELEGLRGRSLEAAFLAPLPDEMRFGMGLVNAAKLSGTLDPEVLRFLNGAGVQLQSYLERSRELLAPRIRVATAAERERG